MIIKVKKIRQTRKKSVTLAHDIFGYTGKYRTRETDKNIGYEITRGSLQLRKSCATGKAKQKNMTKASGHVPATKSKKRVFLDILMIKKPENVNKAILMKKNWRIMVDEFSGMEFSDFYESKNGTIEPKCEIFEKEKHIGHRVKFVRCDNAGEKPNLRRKQTARPGN